MMYNWALLMMVNLQMLSWQLLLSEVRMLMKRLVINSTYDLLRAPHPPLPPAQLNLLLR